MRHGKSGNRLSRNQSLRKATLRDMAKATLIQERICTTKSKAKEARKLIDQLITLGKKGTLADKRRAFAILCDHNLVSDLFDKTAPRFKDRVGGYTRIIPFNIRRGDNAEMVYLELTEKTKTQVSVGRLRGAASQAPVESVDAQDVATVAEAETTEKTDAPKSKGSAKTVKTAKKDAPKKSSGIKSLFKKKSEE